MKEKIYVWDPLVRIFHWTLVLAFITSYTTGEEESSLHIYSGYLIIGLLLFRLVWGFVGSKHARFSDFVKPTKAMGYIKGIITGKPKHYEGHNPAGGLMVVALLFSLAMTGYSGLELYAAEEGQGPLATNSTLQVSDQSLAINLSLIQDARADDDDDGRYGYGEHEGDEDGEEFWEEIHEFFANFTVLLVVLHLAGVIVSSLSGRENLVRAMWTGYKERNN